MSRPWTICGQPLVRHRVQILPYQELSVFYMHNPIAAKSFAFLICLASGLGHTCAQISKYIVTQCAAVVAVVCVDVMQCVYPPQTY